MEDLARAKDASYVLRVLISVHIVHTVTKNLACSREAVRRARARGVTHTTIRYVTYLPAVSEGRMILTTCPRLRP